MRAFAHMRARHFGKIVIEDLAPNTPEFRIKIG